MESAPDRLNRVPPPPPRRRRKSKAGPRLDAIRKARAVAKEWLPTVLLWAFLIAWGVFAYWADHHGLSGGSGP